MSELVPKLRFSGFFDDWVQHKLKYFVEKQIKGKAQFEKLAPGNVEYLDTSRLNGGIPVLTNGFKDVTSDDILILWDGSKAGTVYTGFEGALGSTLKAYRTSADSKFIYQYFKRQQENIYNNYRTPNIPHVQKDFLDIFKISVPDGEEQKKIGSFFKQLDDTIALHQREIDLLKSFKTGLLQKMFPKNGTNTPGLRFVNFDDEWVQRKLRKESIIIAGGDINKTKIKKEGKYPIFANALTNEGIVGYYDYNYRVESPAVTVTGRGDVGHAKARKVNFTPVVRLLSVQSNHDVDFLENAINNHKVLVESTGVPQLTAPQLGNYSIYFPKVAEERKIGSFLEKLDNTIVLHQRQVDLLKLHKKGLLQKMFI